MIMFVTVHTNIAYIHFRQTYYSIHVIYICSGELQREY